MKCQKCWCQCHKVPTVSSMAPFHLIGQDGQKEMQCDVLVMSCHWHQHQHHVMPMASSMEPLCLHSQDNQNEMQHWHCCWHLGANGIASGTIAFLTSRQVKWDVTWIFAHLMALALASVSHHANSIINVTTVILRSGQLKWGATWLFFVMWCNWHQHWHYRMLVALILVSCDAFA